ncbi:hypothetical protein Q9L58_000978 [Maublancomyces gigas]|uniref:Reverse transcriptase domain-containing protein n=1 Tax=Discina gigas TaxID=1032678 RepID=A0ABR3GVC3_9PEZI
MSSFSQTLNSITVTKLQVLSKQHSDFTSHKQQVLDSVKAAIEPHEKLRLLVEGIKSWRSTDTTAESTTTTSHSAFLRNIEKFLKQAQHDPSIGGSIISEWETKLTQSLEKEKVKFEYAELFGRLLTEWVGSAGAKSPEKNGEEEFEKVGRKEMHEQRSTFESYVFTANDTDTTAIEAYLNDLFSLSKDSTNQLNSTQKSMKEFGNVLLRTTFTVNDLKLTIKSLLASNLLSNEKRNTLEEFTLNKAVLIEVADVLNMNLSSLPSWTWGTDAIPVEMVRHLNGKYRIIMDEEILQAIFLEWLGLKWAVQFKVMFREFFDSRAWKSSSKSLTKTEIERRECFLDEKQGAYSLDKIASPITIEQTRRAMQKKDFFMNQLPDHMNANSRGYDNDQDDQEIDDQTSPTETKQSLLHIVTTECLLNTMLYNTFTAVRSDFAWFGPSLPHSSLITVLRFFGVAEIWLTFFQKFLSTPLKFVGDGPLAKTQVRSRGVPISHSLSDMLGEVLLFCMDYAVNQRADGLFLYRVHDDFWFWNEDPTVCVKAWKEMSRFSSLVGLEFNYEKTGSVCVGQPPHPDLPRGPIKWGFLKFEESGQFVIDQSQVDIHIAELKLQLAACDNSLFAWVQVYNKYVSSFFVNNFGSPPAHCFGKRHVDMMISTLERIQLELFPQHKGSVTSYLAEAIQERFGVQNTPAGWYYWPISMGGLGVKNPFIPLYAIRDDICADPITEFRKSCEKDEAAYIIRKERWDNGTIKKPKNSDRALHDAPFMSYEEYILHRPQRSKTWCARYNGLLGPPKECRVALTAEIEVSLNNVSDATASLTGNRGISRGGWQKMNVYWRWVVACYGEGMMEKWGGLEVVRPGSLPVGMVDVWKSKKLKWER